jgi:hypothetical protein
MADPVRVAEIQSKVGKQNNPGFQPRIITPNRLHPIPTGQDMTHQERMLKSALAYRNKFNFSVIPSSKEKKPMVSWRKYQDQMPSEGQIKEWWGKKHPGANISLVCGKVSNRIVVDVDSYKDSEAYKKIEGVTPDNLIMPIVDTPRGGEHRHFLYDQSVPCSGDNEHYIDIKSEGGLALLPPSTFQEKEYVWRNGLTIHETAAPLLPSSYIAFFNKYIYNNLGTESYNTIHGGSNNHQQTPTITNIGFTSGHRDNTLFHLANYLVKSGMPQHEIQQYLLFIGASCSPPFSDKEINLKIQSAINRANVSGKGLTEAIRELIEQHSGNISVTNLQQWVTNANNPQERKKIHVVMGRLEKEGLVKRTGKRAGEYRIVDKDHEVQDWKNASVEAVKLDLPLGMHEAVRVVPGSILMFSGVTNTGKTAFAMNIAHLNCYRGTVKYLTSEIEQDEFRTRVESFNKVHGNTVDDWDVELIAKFTPASLPDLIDPCGLNIIDYLEPPAGDFTQIGPLITDIHHALKKGVAIINIQKKKGDEYGAGGQFVKNKAHLFCTLDVLDYPVCKCTITKCKAPNHGYRNPVNEMCQYKVDVRDGLTIEPIGQFGFSKWAN